MATVNSIGVAPLPVTVNNQTAFGEVSVAQNTGRIFGQFTYNLNTELFSNDSTASGTVTVTPPFANISSGAATNSTGVLTSEDVLEYFPGIGALARFTALYTTGVVGNTQFVGIGTALNGLFIGFNGVDFCINRRASGTNNITTQANFNVDKLDGTGPSTMTLDPTKGNVYQISYQWLGFGQITFSVEDPLGGRFTVFHAIRYANANTTTSITQSTLPFKIESNNTTNATAIVVKVPSLAAFIQGTPGTESFLIHGASNSKTLTTEVAVLTIRNNTTYAGVPNFILVSPLNISAASDGAKSVLFNLYKNATLGGVPSFVDYNANTSVMSIDKAGTTVTGGILLSSIALNKSSNLIYPIANSGFKLHPGDTLTVSAVSAGSNDVVVSIMWQERFK